MEQTSIGTEEATAIRSLPEGVAVDLAGIEEAELGPAAGIIRVLSAAVQRLAAESIVVVEENKRLRARLAALGIEDDNGTE